MQHVTGRSFHEHLPEPHAPELALLPGFLLVSLEPYERRYITHTPASGRQRSGLT